MEEDTKAVTKPRVRLLVPTPPRLARRLERFDQVANLNPLVVSLLGNGKESAQIFFDRFQELFSDRFGGIKIHRFRKSIHSIPCDFLEEVIACSNLVVNATAE